MGKVHELKTPKSGEQIWFLCGDWHSTHVHKASVEILFKHAETLPKEQRNLIINGDFIDAAYMMPKNPDFQNWKDRKDGIDLFFLPAFEEEVEWANQMLDRIQKTFNKVIFIMGNHDKPRLDEFIAKYCPHEYKYHFDLEKKLKTLERKIPVIDYNDWLDFGQVSITHGMYHGPSCYKKHYLAAGSRNVIFSHIHSIGSESFPVRGETRSAWSLPAMCELNPHYIKNRDVNWANGYGTIIMRPNGNFNFYVHAVIDNELLLPSGIKIKAE